MAESRLVLPPEDHREVPMADLRLDRTALAQDHVTGGRRIVARQRELIAEIRARGGDCAGAENLLSAF
jgi:hypothetical protein